eukprot:m.38093 g.38093  ORF g.38093 m.38093 type:complete len:101 (+) comp5484_c0_seq1:1058-1360(+)
MILFNIPDIRLFWLQDDQFLRQFSETLPPGQQKFQPISKFPACTKDITFWLADGFSLNKYARWQQLINHLGLILLTVQGQRLPLSVHGDIFPSLTVVFLK